ncbi:HesA/MoeB/ThiF family protein [Desulfosarcina variabilis]|uniref:HesA/MoeB/ThiF family protein n=1 Tax=Desulfosarcina variabilis TaxID=2300 RepID=UPI003AFB6877
MPHCFTNDNSRFSRQIRLPEVGPTGQKKLHRASVLLVGCGALASSAAYYLAAAGIGRIGIADHDRVEISNLNRQILHDTPRIGMRKVDSAYQTLKALHPSLKLQTIARKLTTIEALSRILAGYDMLIDCTDNFPTRYLINDACLQLSKPWVYASVSGFEGQAMTIIPGRGPCYRCLYPSVPVHTNQAESVMGVSPGIMGIIQAAEAIKYFLGIGSLLVGRMLFVDLLEMNVSPFNVSRNKDCPACARHFA